jgi:uncharacterized protein YjbI with pentapeptide repeats
MGNPEHLKILKQGIEAWKEWRRQYPSLRPDLTEADLIGANLTGANLIGADLSRVDLSQADLSGASLTEADLTEANLIEADLSRADLSRANLPGAHLTKADLTEADLPDADFSQADLTEANLIGANLTEAKLWRTNLTGANLSRADLSTADLSQADLIRANLDGANLYRVVFGGTVFGSVNLSTVKALESCVHYGPSYLDYHTLARSGTLPLNFLRDCGLSDEFINYLPSLFGQAIEYYSCFISYSTKDEEFAQRIHADLQNKGVRCWFAPHHIQGGKKIHEQIDEAIRVYDRLLLILSEHSMKSDWVETEISKARKRELREHRRMLFPVRLVDIEKLRDWERFDADIGKDSAREIREYFIPDFSNWKNHDSYQNSFGRLLQDLKPEKVEAKLK